MADFEDRLRAEVTRHTEEFSPSPDLPERIHTQVGRRSRQRRAVAAGALSVGAAAIAIPALLLVTRPSDDTTVVTDGTRPTPTASSDLSTTTDPAGRSGTGPEGTETTDTTTQPSPTSSEPVTRPPSTTGTTTTTQPDLKPPDSQTPAAGVCSQAPGGAADVTMNFDVPSPRCTEVTPDQILRVFNNTEEEITVSLADFSATIAPGGPAAVFDTPFGEYLQPGVHRINVSPLYGESGPVIWLKEQ